MARMDVEVTGAYEIYLLVCRYVSQPKDSTFSLKHRGSQLPLTCWWGVIG
jgi:hypothetical protein